jgi:hypothetical protein
MPPSMPIPPLLRRSRTWLVVAGLLVAWVLAGFVGVPRLAAGLLRDTVAADYGRELAVGAVAFNPFTLALEVRDLALPDADGGPLVACRRLFVDLEVSSLWRRAWTFRAVAIDGLEVTAVVRPGGALNLADLAADPAPAPAAAEPLPRLFIGELAISAGRIRYTDQDRPQPFTAELAPLDFALRDFSTHVDAGERYELAATLFGGTALRWQGSLRPEPLASDGEFSITGLPLPELGRFLGDALPLELASGTLRVAGRYALADGADGITVRVAGGEVGIAGLGLRPVGGSADLVTVPTLALSGIAADTTSRRVSVAAVTAADGIVAAVLAPDGSLNLAALAGPPAPAATGGPSAPVAPPPAPPAGAGPDWTVAIDRLALTGFRVAVTDQSVSPAVTVSLAPLALEATGLATAPGSVVRARLDTGVNEGATLAVTAETQLDTLATTADVTLAGLALAAFQPYVDSLASLAIRRGTLGVTGRVVATPAGDTTDLAFDGDVTITDLRAVDTVLDEDFLRLRSLRLAGVGYRSAPAAMRVREVVATAPYARIIIGPDGVTNLDTILATPGPAAPAAGAGGNAPAPAPAPAPSEPSLPLRIDVVRIVDGSTNFADFSIQPRFATGIEKLNGTVRGLASDPAARAQVELDGQVDRFSPVTIRGEVNPLAAETTLDLTMGFRNFELASFTPYSGRFAGYKIRQGKLTVDLRYLVADRQLKADHRIVIDQLELGEKVESPEAVGLPLKLAVALLKDRNGVIDLELPVQGSLDDPQFRVGPILWKVLVNLLTKAATAPFALLGSLVGGGEEINRLDFAPGSTDLAADAVAPLVRALTERPGLALDVPAVYSPASDGPVLTAERLRSAVVRAKRRELTARKADPDGADWAAISADPDDYLRQLTAAWRRAAGAEAPLPEPPATAADGTPVPRGDPAARIAALEDALRTRLAAGDAEFFALARARAERVQALLLEGTGVAPERVFLVSPSAVPAAGDRVVMELALH